MPVKVRRPKRRMSVAAELEAWSVLFATGYDFFGDLGFPKQEEARKAARDAWERLGPAFMARWTPSSARSVPWALEAFGEPQGSLGHAG